MEWSPLLIVPEKHTDAHVKTCGRRLPVCCEPLQPSSAVRGRVATCHGYRGFITKDSSPSYAFFFSWFPTQKKKKRNHISSLQLPPLLPPSPWQDRRKKKTHTQAPKNTAVLTLLCLRRHLVDTWWNIQKTQTVNCFSALLFFPPRRCVSLSRGKKKWTCPPSQLRLGLIVPLCSMDLWPVPFLGGGAALFFFFCLFFVSFFFCELLAELKQNSSRAFFFFFLFFHSKDVILSRRGGECWYTAATAYLSKWTDPALTNCHSRKIRQPPHQSPTWGDHERDTPDILVYIPEHLSICAANMQQMVGTCL